MRLNELGVREYNSTTNNKNCYYLYMLKQEFLIN